MQRNLFVKKGKKLNEIQGVNSGERGTAAFSRNNGENIVFV